MGGPRAKGWLLLPFFLSRGSEPPSSRQSTLSFFKSLCYGQGRGSVWQVRVLCLFLMFCPASAVSARSLFRDRKPYQWETYLGGQPRRYRTSHFLSSRGQAPTLLKVPTNLVPYIFVSTPKSGGLEQSTFGRVSRRSFKIMRALNLTSLFSPQPLQWLPISLEKKAEAEGPPTTPLSHCCSVTPCCGHALLFGHIAYLLFLYYDKHPLKYTPPPVSI